MTATRAELAVRVALIAAAVVLGVAALWLWNRAWCDCDPPPRTAVDCFERAGRVYCGWVDA